MMGIQEMRHAHLIIYLRFYYTTSTSPYTYYRQKIYIEQIQYAIDTILKYYYPCFIPWPRPRPGNWQWGAVKNETFFLVGVVLLDPQFYMYVL